jgi:hypothetical protein
LGRGGKFEPPLEEYQRLGEDFEIIYFLIKPVLLQG